MATVKDVEAAVGIVAGDLLNNGWRPWRSTHIEKSAYSILFLQPEETATRRKLTSAIAAVAAVQNNVARKGWHHDPLVLVFPLDKYRINVRIPPWAHVRGRHVTKVMGIPLRRYTTADAEVADVLAKCVGENTKHLLSNTVQESLAAFAWWRAIQPDAIARNVEITVPAPYPDKIRYRSRMFRDYGVTLGEFDAVAVINGRIRIMEAKAANGGPRRWTAIIRHKIMSYSGAVPALGRNVRSDFVITSNSGELAVEFARKTKDLLANVPFAADVYGAWVRHAVRWVKV